MTFARCLSRECLALTLLQVACGCRVPEPASELRRNPAAEAPSSLASAGEARAPELSPPPASTQQPLPTEPPPPSPPVAPSSGKGVRCELFHESGREVLVHFDDVSERLADGTPVTCSPAKAFEIPSEALSKRAWAQVTNEDVEPGQLRRVEIEGRAAWVASGHVLVGDGWRLHFAPVAAGDCLHCAAWLVSPTRTVTPLAEVSCASTWAWSPDARTLAFGTWSLQVIQVQGNQLVSAETFENITSPVFTPDGRLFARRNVAERAPFHGTLEHWQCVERQSDGAWSLSAPGVLQVFPACTDCSCQPDALPPAPVVGPHRLLDCPPAPAEREGAYF